MIALLTRETHSPRPNPVSPSLGQVFEVQSENQEMTKRMGRATVCGFLPLGVRVKGFGLWISYGRGFKVKGSSFLLPDEGLAQRSLRRNPRIWRPPKYAGPHLRCLSGECGFHLELPELNVEV